MKCADARELLSAYLDDALDANQRARLADHLRDCPVCAAEFEALRQTIALVGGLEEIEPPPEFHAKLTERLRGLSAGGGSVTRSRRAAWLQTLTTVPLRNAIAAAVVLAVTLTGGIGIGARLASRPDRANLLAAGDTGVPNPNVNSQMAGPDNGLVGGINEGGTGTGRLVAGNTQPDMGAAAAGKALTTFKADESASQPGQKIIRNCDITLAVEDIAAAQQEVAAIGTANGGYVENSSFQQISETSACAMVQLRIPNGQLDAAAAQVKKLGQVRSEGTSANDVTTTYTDTDARLKNLQLQEERLREVLGKATTVDDILQVENELAQVRTDIEIATASLKNLQSGVEMATLTVNLEQNPDAVAVGAGQPFWNRVRGACLNTLKAIGRFFVGFAIFVGGALPVLAIVAVLWLAIRPRRWFHRGQ